MAGLKKRIRNYSKYVEKEGKTKDKGVKNKITFRPSSKHCSHRFFILEISKLLKHPMTPNDLQTQLDIINAQPLRTPSANEFVLETFSSPLGEMYCLADSNCLYMLDYLDCPALTEDLSDLRRRLHGNIVRNSNPITTQTRQQLQQYFQGTRTRFTVPVRHLGTPFQLVVWQALTAIPYGATWSYAEQARYLQRPKAVRAVAHTNGRNRISIICPCHRVIGSNGSLTGYAGGLARKAWLLAHERDNAPIERVSS